MSRLTIISGLALSASLLAGPLSAQEETGGFGVPKDTTLETVRRSPHAFKNVWIRFTGHFFGIGTVHNPFFTRFTRSDFVNFGLWADDQKIWERKEFDNPCSTLFCQKTSGELLTQIYALQRYERVTLTGIVRNAFQGEPFIEVTSVQPAEGKLTTATLTHMARAHQLMQNHKWQQAALELNLASSQSLTNNARGWIHAYLGLSLMRIGRPFEAKKQLTKANKMLPNEQIVEEWMETLAKDPRSVVDNHVRVSAVRRGDRPMWEAVGDKKKNAKAAPNRGLMWRGTNNRSTGRSGSKQPARRAMDKKNSSAKSSPSPDSNKSNSPSSNKSTGAPATPMKK